MEIVAARISEHGWGQSCSCSALWNSALVCWACPRAASGCCSWMQRLNCADWWHQGAPAGTSESFPKCTVLQLKGWFLCLVSFLFLGCWLFWKQIITTSSSNLLMASLNSSASIVSHLPPGTAFLPWKLFCLSDQPKFSGSHLEIGSGLQWHSLFLS